MDDIKKYGTSSLSTSVRRLLYNEDNGIIQDVEFYINTISYYDHQIKNAICREEYDPLFVGLDKVRIPFQNKETGDTSFNGAKYLYQFFVEGLVQYIRTQSLKESKKNCQE